MRPRSRREFMKLAAGATLLGGVPLLAANNGTVVGSPTFGAAKFGSGVTVLSDVNYITLPTAVSSALVANFTIEFWLKRASAPGGLEIPFSPPNTAWLGVASTGQFQAATEGGGFGPNICDNAFHHIAYVIGANLRINIYIDGTNVYSTTTVVTDPGAGACTVGRHTSTGFAWGGAMDEVAVFSTERYTANFTAPTAAYTGSETGLVYLGHLESDGTDSTGSGSTVPPNRIGGHISGGVFAY